MSFTSRADDSPDAQQVAESEPHDAGASNSEQGNRTEGVIGAAAGSGLNGAAEGATEARGGAEGATETRGRAEGASEARGGAEDPMEAGDSVLEQTEELYLSARVDLDDEDDDSFHSAPEIGPDNVIDEAPDSVHELEESEPGDVDEIEELESLSSEEELEVVDDENDEDEDNFVIVNFDRGETDSEESEDEQDRNTAITYDRSVPSSHTYLGSDLEDVHGRALFDEGSVITIPAHSQHGVILVPGQVMPLHLTHPQQVAMMRTAVEQHKTIAVLHYRTEPMRRYRETPGMLTHALLSTGTTAEILSINSDNPDDPTSMVSAITRGRQRFQLDKVARSLAGVSMATIKILPEIKCSEPLDLLVPFSHQRCRVAANTRKHRKAIVHNRCSYLSHWPQWVYTQYSPKCLMEQLKKEIERQWGSKAFAAMENITCPDQLTYWVADNIPMMHQSKFYFLELNSNVQRLRYQLHLIQKYTNLLCSNCKELIAKKSEVFSLSYEGPMGTYVNNYGSVHETLTVRKAKNLSLTGRPSTEFSWFPGYAWTIATCHTCGEHKGWKFTSKSLQPKSFYGLTRNGLVPGLNQNEALLDEFGNIDYKAFVI